MPLIDDQPSDYLRALILIARAEEARSGGGDSADQWRVVVSTCDHALLIYHAAHGRYRSGEALLREGDRRAAVTLLSAALDTAESLGATPLRDAVLAARPARREYPWVRGVRTGPTAHVDQGASLVTRPRSG